MYGIANCSTVKKARAWLDGHGVAYEFIDFKNIPPTREQLARWCAVLGTEAVMNTRGTTWRTLDAVEQARAQTESGAIAVLLAHPSAIKRPVIEHHDSLLIGFDETRYAAELQTR